MNIHILQIKKLNPLAVIPTKGSPKAAGYDLFSTEDFVLMPMNRHLFKTGLSMAIPSGMYGRIAPRSGLAFKDGIDTLAGVIDEDYRGDVGIILINFGITEKQFKVGDKIAQIIFEYYNNVDIQVVDDLNETNRGISGFGSTDIKKPSDIETSKKVTGNIINLWKKSDDGQKPLKYETIIKEREKAIS